MRLVRFLMLAAGVMLAMEACAGTALATPVPEIDPSAAGSGIALLAGGILLFHPNHQT